MDKREALKLQPGDVIMFDDGPRDALGWSKGEVLHVTPNGGIKVSLIGRRGNCDDNKPIGGVEWVPYHHVLRHD
jgi:hypothetical protein